METRWRLAEEIACLSPEEGLNETLLPSVQCVRNTQTTERRNQRWRASVCVVVQGSKELVLGQEVYRNEDEAHFIVTPVDLPVTSRIFSASLEKPFLSLRLDFDSVTLADLSAQINLAEAPDNHPLRGIFLSEASEGLLEASLRLARLLHDPEDARVLGPSVIREILYLVLKGPDGPAIRQFTRSGSKVHKISQAVHNLLAGYQEAIDVEALAQAANMSRSAFFKEFKQVTSMSPIQYQKRLRLLEAQRLITNESETAERAAYRVGYRSASQFSREYSRMFGNPPARDAQLTVSRRAHDGLHW
jgi:AraC-like DNA-binding protein